MENEQADAERDGTAEPNSQDQILRRERRQGKWNFPCSADHEQDWQPYPVDAQSAESDDHTHFSRKWSLNFNPDGISNVIFKI